MPGLTQFTVKQASTMNSNKINIEIAYASESDQELIKLELDSGTTAIQAIKNSKLLQMYPEINPDECQLGIYSKKIDGNAVLQNNDRIEVYRALKISPKESRRLRAELAKKKN